MPLSSQNAEYGHPCWVFDDLWDRRNRTNYGRFWSAETALGVFTSASGPLPLPIGGCNQASGQKHLVSCNEAVPLIDGELALIDLLDLAGIQS